MSMEYRREIIRGEAVPGVMIMVVAWRLFFRALRLGALVRRRRRVERPMLYRSEQCPAAMVETSQTYPLPAATLLVGGGSRAAPFLLVPCAQGLAPPHDVVVVDGYRLDPLVAGSHDALLGIW